MYTIKAVSPVKKDLKKLPQKIVQEIKDQHFPILKENPSTSPTLSGKFNDLRSYHFKSASIDYRIIYHIYEDEKIVRIIMIGPRENIYKKLKLRVQ